jgi:hypothetical protein
LEDNIRKVIGGFSSLALIAALATRDTVPLLKGVFAVFRQTALLATFKLA